MENIPTINEDIRNLKAELAELVKLAHPEYQYLNLLDDILNNGGGYSVFISKEMQEIHYSLEDVPFCRGHFGTQMTFDLKNGFPLFTTKKTWFKGIAVELLWLLKGSGNIKFLVDNGVSIWNEWGHKKYIDLSHKEGVTTNLLTLDQYIDKIKTDLDFASKYGDLGSAYPVNWRHFKGHGDREADQIKWVIDGLRSNKDRRHYVVSAWHPCYTYEMAREGESMSLPPCHAMFQFKVNPEGELDCAMYQRSADMFLGVPFNVASYSLLTHMVAHVCDLPVGKFVHFLADYHLYSNHFEQVEEQLTRTPYPFPKLKLNSEISEIDDFTLDHLKLVGYQSHPPLQAKVAPVGGV